MLKRIDELTVREPFSILFEITTEALNSVRERMETEGFDMGQPIHVWEEADGNLTVVDGHTRLRAAVLVELESVPVHIHLFADEQEALWYALRNQRDRRHTSGKDIIRAVEIVDEVAAHGGDRRSDDFKGSEEPLKSADRTAETIGVSASTVKRARAVNADPEVKAEVEAGVLTLAPAAKKARANKKAAKQADAPAQEPPKKKTRATFNAGETSKVVSETEVGIEWARWSWNPVTGCEHDCSYCYAHDIAARFYQQGMKPTFYPERLDAPQNTKVPAKAVDDPGYGNVFVCSMADLFGEWVPQQWIDDVMKSVCDAPDWTFLFLSKNPARMATVEWPQNAWVGTTVDEQSRVAPAIAAFSKIRATTRFLSCEPLREALVFPTLKCFDWVIVGGQSEARGCPASQPEWAWVESLWMQVRAAKKRLYFKPNLTVRPREYPEGMSLRQPAQCKLVE